MLRPMMSLKREVEVNAALPGCYTALLLPVRQISKLVSVIIQVAVPGAA